MATSIFFFFLTSVPTVAVLHRHDIELLFFFFFTLKTWPHGTLGILGNSPSAAITLLPRRASSGPSTGGSCKWQLCHGWLDSESVRLWGRRPVSGVFPLSSFHFTRMNRRGLYCVLWFRSVAQRGPGARQELRLVFLPPVKVGQCQWVWCPWHGPVLCVTVLDMSLD